MRVRKELHLDPKPFDFDLQLFGSSAGANFVWKAVLSIRPGAAAVSAPLAGYGTIGTNDSGLILFEGRAYSKAAFQICPEPPPFGQLPYPAPNTTALATGYAVSVYYTLDTTCKLGQQQNGQNGGNTDATGWTGVPVGSWTLLPALGDQTGTGADANPMTSATNPGMSGARGAAGYRVVLTTKTGTPSAGVVVYAMEIP